MKLSFIQALLLLITPTLLAVPAAAQTLEQATQSEEALQIAQMTQTYCIIAGVEGGIGVNLYDSPNGAGISRYPNGETVAFNLSDRSGMWSEVTGPDGMTGWVESQFLACDQYGTSDVTYDETYYGEEQSYTEESYYSEEESYSEETHYGEDAYYGEESYYGDESGSY